jgi:hypothetical protein
MRNTRRRAVGALAAFVLCASTLALAAPVDYTLDPARSTFRLGGTFNGAPLVPQSAGTDGTGFAGTLSVDVDRSAGTVSFTSTAPNALPQAADQQPLSTSGEVARYGLTTAGAQPAYLAVRSIDFFLEAEDAPLGVPNPTTSQVGFFVNGGTLFYSSQANPTGGADLHGYGGGGDRTIGALTLTRDGDLELLTIPIRTQFTPYTGEDGDAVFFTLEGQLVATRLVPEPGAAASLLGLGFLALWRRR